MRVGDVLEIIGAVCLTVAAYLYFGIPGLAGAGGISLIYIGNCFAAVQLPGRETKRKLDAARAQLELALATPGFFPTDIERLKEQVAYWESRPQGPLPGHLEIHALWRARHIHKLGEG